MRCGRVSPRVRKRLKRGAGLGDGVEDVEQVAGAAGQAIEASDDHGVALGERLDQLGKLGAIRSGAADLLGADAFDSGGLQRGLWRGAEPASLRRRHGRPLALGPAHGEGVRSVPQQISTRPLSVDSAPYLPALVASSWSASPMACAEAAVRRNLGPSTAIREPMRLAKCAS